MSISLLQHTQGIIGYQHHFFEYGPGIVIAHISKKKNKIKCPCCRSSNITATRSGERIIKALPMGKMKACFNLKMHRVKCHNCGIYKMEDVQFLSAATSRVTKAMERSVLELRKEMNIKALAKYLNLHWDTVKNIEAKNLQKKYKHIRLKDVEAIGIDEVHMGEKLGDKGYLTIVRDLKSGAVLFVGKGRKGNCLDEFALKIKRSRAIIKTVAVDLAPSFTSWIKSNFSNALIVYDHFHVIKLMNEKLNNIRRRTMNTLEEHEKKALKNRRWHFIINRENLTPKAAQELEECKDIFKELSVAYQLKESLRNIYSIANSKDLADIAFRRWHDMAISSEIPEMLTMANTIKRHIDGILAYWTTDGMTSASMEGFNNKIGWLTRQAYGYRDEEYLILKIYDLPNLKLTNVL